MAEPLLTGDPDDPRFRSGGWEEQKYLEEIGFIVSTVDTPPQYGGLHECGHCWCYGPDADGNYDLLEDPECPQHGGGT